MLGGAALRAKDAGLFREDNLLAWCIVPFDARQRGPEERAAMLARLGLRKFVYDWREKDVPHFDAEVDALQRHGIALHGFWTPCPADGTRQSRVPEILSLLKRRRLRTELWLSLSFDKGFEALAQAGKVNVTAEAVRRIAGAAGELGCRVGLYNHGGWYGEPENQMEVLEKAKAANAGIVYNFHHGHDHVARFPRLLAAMKPHLFAVNINGMRHGTKILPVGDGDLELEMLRAMVQSGYDGPVGILGHRAEMDAEQALRLNLEGLKRLRARLG